MTKKPDRDPKHILSPVEQLSAFVRSLQCSLILKESGSANGILVSIQPESYSNIAKSVFITGDTSLIGFVERVGGATVNKCGLRVAFQPRMLICDVQNTELARRLGERLKQEVVVQGTATWLKTTWQVFHFKIKDVHQLKNESLADAIDVIREAGAKAWDKIEDPKAFLEGMRE